jgi:hypothetical protein
VVRLDETVLGDLGNARVDARLLQAILARDRTVSSWLQDRGITSADVDDAFPGSGWT